MIPPPTNLQDKQINDDRVLSPTRGIIRRSLYLTKKSERRALGAASRTSSAESILHAERNCATRPKALMRMDVQDVSESPGMHSQIVQDAQNVRRSSLCRGKPSHILASLSWRFMSDS